MDQYPNLINNCKWQISEVKEQNKYVDLMLRDFQAFAKKLEAVQDKLSQKVLDEIWSCAIAMAMEAMVEGFSLIKKCSDMGHALMKLDYNSFQNGIKKLTSLKEIPNNRFVLSYIEGWMYPPDALSSWIELNYKVYSQSVF